MAPHRPHAHLMPGFSGVLGHLAARGPPLRAPLLRGSHLPQLRCPPQGWACSGAAILPVAPAPIHPAALRKPAASRQAGSPLTQRPPQRLPPLHHQPPSARFRSVSSPAAARPAPSPLGPPSDAAQTAYGLGRLCCTSSDAQCHVTIHTAPSAPEGAQCRAPLPQRGTRAAVHGSWSRGRHSWPPQHP